MTTRHKWVNIWLLIIHSACKCKLANRKCVFKLLLWRQFKLNSYGDTAWSGITALIFRISTVSRVKRHGQYSCWPLSWVINTELKQDIITLKVPRKSASENVVCLCRLLHLLANFSNLHYAYRQTVWTQIRLLLKEQSDLGPHCLQQWLLK